MAHVVESKRDRRTLCVISLPSIQDFFNVPRLQSTKRSRPPRQKITLQWQGRRIASNNAAIWMRRPVFNKMHSHITNRGFTAAENVFFLTLHRLLPLGNRIRRGTPGRVIKWNKLLFLHRAQLHGQLSRSRPPHFLHYWPFVHPERFKVTTSVLKAAHRPGVRASIRSAALWTTGTKSSSPTFEP